MGVSAVSAESTSVRPIISADSHVIEPLDVWDGLIPREWWGNLQKSFGERPGGFDPKARTDEMDVDAVSAEVLYPSLALKLFAEEDAAHQAACLRRYNEWLIDYCSVAPDRLAGIGQVATYDMDVAVAEAQWCHDHGLCGVEVWMSPPPHLPFNGRHYEPFWEVCSALGLPVSLHIHSGFDYSKEMLEHPDPVSTRGPDLEVEHQSEAARRDRCPRRARSALECRTGTGGCGSSWSRTRSVGSRSSSISSTTTTAGQRHGSPVQLDRLPSEIFTDQVAATFFRDPDAAYVATRFGGSSIMWSSDYPHGNSTWPNSQEVVAEHLGRLPDDVVRRVVWDNVKELYGLTLALTNP